MKCGSKVRTAVVATAVAILVVLVAGNSWGGKCEADIESSGYEFVVRNMSDVPVKPRIIMRGWTHGEVMPPRHARDLRLNDLLLTGRMLTGSTLILEPDGSGKWGYRTGFTDWIEDPPTANKDKWVEHRNVWWDSDPPQAVGVRTHQYVMHLSGEMGWSITVELPEGVKVRSLAIHASTTGNLDSYEATTLVSDGKSPGNELSECQGNTFPHKHDDLPSTFKVTFKSTPRKSGKRSFFGLYRVWLSAELDATTVPRLELQPGVNVVKAVDHPDSSHQWRVVLEHEALADNPPPAAQGTIPDFVRNHVSRFRQLPPRQGRPVPADEFFPLGIYTGMRAEMLDFVVDDMVNHHCNAIYTSNNTLENLREQLELCARAGIKVLHQGGSPSGLYYLNYRYSFLKRDPELEVRHNIPAFRRAAKEIMPSLTNQWSLLAWSPVEEQPPDKPLLQRITKAIDIVREADPHHPVNILYNNIQTMQLDIDIGRPQIATTDIYAYSMDVASTRETRDEAAAWILSRATGFRRAGEPRDIPLWFMGQIWGEPARENFKVPPYSVSGGMRLMLPADMRAQGWLAIAAGARGIFFYAYHSYTPDQYQCLDSAFRSTERWHAVGHLYREIKPLTPLLLKLKPVEEFDKEFLETTSPCIAVRPFVRRDLNVDDLAGHYVVAVNWDPRSSRAVNLKGTITRCETMWDVKKNNAIPLQNTLRLEPGEGTILWLGNSKQPAADQQFLIQEHQRWQLEYGL